MQYDQQGQAIKETLQIATPTSWGLTLPTYTKMQVSNSANQPTTTQAKKGTTTSYTFTNAYNSFSGMLIGLSDTTTGTPTLVEQQYNEYGLVCGLTFFTDTGS